MFVPDMPPEVPPQYTPVLIAQAAPADQTTRTIGVCHLIQNPPEPSGTAVNSLSPLTTVYTYFKWFEQRELGLEGKVTLLQGAAHGALEGDDRGSWGYFPITPDYHGPDHATFLVEVGGYKFKVMYGFNVLAHVPSGTEGYDPYEDKEYCPNGEFWRIFPDGGVVPLHRKILNEESLAPTVQWASDTLGADKLNLTFAPLADGAVGQAKGDTITLDDNANGYNWYVDLTPIRDVLALLGVNANATGVLADNLVAYSRRALLLRRNAA